MAEGITIDGNIAFDRTYNIEGHLNVRLILKEDGEWFYSFFDDGKDAEEALKNGGKLAITNYYRVTDELQIHNLSKYVVKWGQSNPKTILNFLCGEDKYIIQRKTFDDNTSLVALTFIGFEKEETHQSINRIIIDNGDKKTGIRKRFVYERYGDDDHNQSRIKWRGVDYTKKVPEFRMLVINNVEKFPVPNGDYGINLRFRESIDAIVGPEEYSFLYNCAVKFDGIRWRILDGEGKCFPGCSYSDIKVDGNAFLATSFIGLHYPEYLTERIDETTPVGLKDAKIFFTVDKEYKPGAYFNGIPLIHLRKLDQGAFEKKGNRFILRYTKNGATITRTGTLTDDNKIIGTIQTRFEIPYVSQSSGIELKHDITGIENALSDLENLNREFHLFHEREEDNFKFPYIKLFSCKALGSKLIARFKSAIDKPLSKVKK